MVSNGKKAKRSAQRSAEAQESVEQVDLTSSSSSTTVVCSSCKKEGHKDARSGACENNKRNKTCSRKAQGEDEEGQEHTEREFHETWTKQAKKPLELLSRKEAEDVLHLNRDAEIHIKNIVARLDGEWQTEGKTAETLKEIDVFNEVLGQGKNLLLEWMNKRIRLHKLKIREVEEWEFYSFLGMLVHLLATSVPKQRAFIWYRGMFTRDGLDRHVLSDERFDEIQRVLSGFRHQMEATGSSHADCTDMASRFGILEEALSRFPLAVVPDKVTRVTIDDRLLGSRSKSNPLNTYRPRKVKKNGVGSDAIADSAFRLLLSNRLYNSQYSQAAALDALFNKLQAGDKDVQGIEVTLDRGYGDAHLYQKCAKRGFSLVVINDKSSQQGNPFMASSVANEKGLKIKHTFLIQNGPKHGEEIFTATKSLSKGSGSQVTAHAFAVREFGDEASTHVHRFVTILPKHLTDRFANTYVMEPYPRVTIALQRDWLFYPPMELDAEDFIDVDSDYTSGESDNDYDDDYEEEEDNPEEDGDDDDEDDDEEEEENQQEVDTPHAATDGNGEIDRASHCEQVSQESDDLENEDGRELTQTQRLDDIDLASESDDETWIPDMLQGPALYLPTCPGRAQVEAMLLETIEPLTAGQRCADWFKLRTFLVTGTTAQEIACRDPEVRKTLYQDPTKGKTDAWTTQEVASKLFDSWFYVPKSAGSTTNRHLITGTKNEGGVVKELKQKPYFLAVFEIGLVRSRFDRGLGVSADNIVIVVPPGKDPESPHCRILAPLEIKTKCTKRQIKAPTDIMKEKGEYFECTAGTPDWFKVVPREYRGQVIHQAVVFGTRHTVFVIATVTRIVYTVLITFPESVLAAWKLAYENIMKRHVEWAWNALDSDSTPKIPKSFSDVQIPVIKSRFPMWKALHRRRPPNGTLQPIRVLRSLIQLYYSKGKQGVDGVDDYANRLQTRALNLDWEKKVVVGRIADCVVNAGIFYRLYKVQKENKPWRGLANFLKRCSRLMTMSEFASLLSEQLLLHAAMLFVGRSNNQVSHSSSPQVIQVGQKRMRALTPEEIEQLKFRGNPRNVLAKANTPAVKRLRLSGNKHTEKPIVEGNKRKNRKCVVCSEDTKMICNICNIPLHFQKKTSVIQKVTCWEKWHTNQCLKKQHLKKKSNNNNNNNNNNN